MSDEAERLKRDLQTIKNAMGVDLWTRRDVRRALLGVAGGAADGIFLCVWSAMRGPPEGGLIIFLAVLAGILILKAAGFERQPGPGPGSRREIAFYNRFFTVGGVLIGCFYMWGSRRGLDPLTLFAATVVMAGAWYLYYAISAPSRWISLGGALPLTCCGFMLGGARDFSDAVFRLGVAVCAGCAAEAAFLLVALRRPPGPAPGAPPWTGPIPIPAPRGPVSPVHDAAH